MRRMIRRLLPLFAALLLPLAGPPAANPLTSPRLPVPVEGALLTADRSVPALSFVVTPLRNASDDPGQAYVAEGLTDYVTRDLSRIHGSFVIARASAAALADAKPAELAGEFAVRYVISGTAGTQGGRLAVELSLFDAATDKTGWSGKFARDAGALGALRNDILARLAEETGAPPGAVGALPMQGREPGEALLRARALLIRPQNPVTVAEARRLLEGALKEGASRDAEDGLAAIHLLEAVSGWSPAPAQDLRRARQLIDAAIAGDPGDARAQALNVALLRLAKHPAEALAAYEAAVAADPNLAESHAEIGRVKIDLGQAGDTVPAIEKALALSPRDPQRVLWLSFAGMAELYAGRPKAAVPWLERSAALMPSFVNARIWLAASHQLAGATQKAKAAAQEAAELSPGLTLARVARQLPGDTAETRRRSEEILDALRRAGIAE